MRAEGRLALRNQPAQAWHSGRLMNRSPIGQGNVGQGNSRSSYSFAHIPLPLLPTSTIAPASQGNRPDPQGLAKPCAARPGSALRFSTPRLCVQPRRWGTTRSNGAAALRLRTHRRARTGTWLGPARLPGCGETRAARFPALILPQTIRRGLLQTGLEYGGTRAERWLSAMLSTWTRRHGTCLGQRATRRGSGRRQEKRSLRDHVPPLDLGQIVPAKFLEHEGQIVARLVAQPPGSRLEKWGWSRLANAPRYASAASSRLPSRWASVPRRKSNSGSAGNSSRPWRLAVQASCRRSCSWRETTSRAYALRTCDSSGRETERQCRRKLLGGRVLAHVGVRHAEVEQDERMIWFLGQFEL